MSRVRFSISVDEDLDLVIALEADRRRTSKAQIVREVLVDHYHQELAELAEQRVEPECLP